MADPIIIDFNSTKLDALTKRCEKAAMAAERAAYAFGMLQAVGGAPSGAGSGASSGARGSKGVFSQGGGRGPRPRVPPLPKTPKAPPSFGSRIRGALSSSRLNVSSSGVSVSPLIGQLFRALAKSGPIGEIIAGATAAGGAMIALAHTAAQTAEEFAKLQFAFGSNGRTTAFLQGLGFNGGASSGFQGRITSDPFAMMAAMRLGIHALPRPFGNVDEGSQLERAIRGLRSIKDRNQQIRMARMLGLDEDAHPLLISDKQFRMHDKDAAVRAGIATPQFGQQAADFVDSIGRVGTAVQNLIMALGKPVIKDLTDYLNKTADLINKIANINASGIRIVMDVIMGLFNLMTGRLPEAFGDLKDIREAAAHLYDKHSNALDKNTAALQANTDALMPGMYGSGDRLNAALPGGMTGEYLRRSLELGGMRLGAFG